MEREVQHKVDGEMKTEIQYYHRIVVVVLVGTSFPIPLGVRFQKNGEAEVSCALALLQDLVAQLGRGLDVLVGDALYLQAPFVQEVERLGLVLGFHPENQPELLHEAERCTQDSPHGVQAEPGREIQYWHLPGLDWPVADRPVRVVRAKSFASPPSAASWSAKKMPIAAKARRKYRNRAPTSTPPISNSAPSRRCSFIQFSRSRWRISTSLPDHHHHRLSPQTHPAVHQTAAWWC